MLSKFAKGFFITSTDTNAGKTTITKLLITECIKQGYLAIGCKPIGCSEDPQGINEDAIAFMEINSINLPMSVVNPLRFNQPVSPNIAAKIANRPICLEDLTIQLRRLYSLPVDYIFFEGVGGWKVPLNDKQTTADLVLQLDVPVILVVGIRVGCLNHALLTCDALWHDDIPVIGWIANVIDPTTPHIPEHVTTLAERMDLPYLGTVPFLDHTVDEVCPIDMGCLMRS